MTHSRGEGGKFSVPEIKKVFKSGGHVKGTQELTCEQQNKYSSVTS